MQIQGYFGAYDFTFYANQQCRVGGTLEPVYQVEGERCVSLGDLNPESFEVEFVADETTKRSAAPVLEARQGGLESSWEVSAFSDINCGGMDLGDYLQTTSTCHDLNGSSSTPKSFLLTSDSGTYDFTFYSTSTCAATGINEEIYEVTTGESLCVNLPTLDAHSFQIETIVAGSK